MAAVSVVTAAPSEPNQDAGPGGLDWSLSARGIDVGGVGIGSVEARSSAGSAPVVRVLDIDLPQLGAWGVVTLRCAPGPVPCASGTLDRYAPSSTEAAASAGFERDADGIRLSSEGGEATLGPGTSTLLELRNWPLAPWLTETALPIELQGGRLNAAVTQEGDALRFDSDLDAVDFDTEDGRFAGAGVQVALRGRWGEDRLEGQWSWSGGELLLDAVYLPPPPSELRADYAIDFAGEHPEVRIGLDADDWLDATLTASLDLAADPSLDLLRQAVLEIDTLDLASAWTLGIESLAARAGWPDLEVQGRLSGSLERTANGAEIIDLDWQAVTVDDPLNRLQVRGLEGQLRLGGATEQLVAAFDAATVYRLPLGASRLALAGDRGRILLEAPVRVPLLDGAILLDRLVVDRSSAGPPVIDLDLAIEPLELERLTGILGLPRFGGSVSGRIPEMRLDGETLRVGGGLDLEMFSGHARVTGLSIERPFGTLPALSASLEFERLDLAPLTTAFEFGAMQGELSGYVRGLRLLDWQPVAFDAWLATERETDKPRRISQRAVDQIARLGGGGAAALSAPILRLFDDFAYNRIALGCRLAANVCTMRGVREQEGGGYVIVDGRGIPRLDVIGYRREVDWPVLLAQLEAATRGDGVRVGN